MEIVTRWFGAFAVDAGRVVALRPFPTDPAVIRERWRLRESGAICAEERDLVETLRREGRSPLTSRDVRLRPLGLEPAEGFLPRMSSRDYGIDPSWEREILLEHGVERLAGARDPSITTVEAVRSIEDMESALNLLGERLVNWWMDEDPAALDRIGAAPGKVAREMADGAGSASPVEAGRAALATLYLDLRKARDAMEKGVEAEASAHYPNLSLVLGPLLAARMVAKAGGLERLARMPASTVQVLGSERAFFAHLREGGPPPKYGLLFLHPLIQGAPAPRKGRVARTLAGKTAIAARRDFAGSGALPALQLRPDGRAPPPPSGGRPLHPSGP